METIPSCAAGVPIFRVLPAAGLAELGEAMRHRRYAKGELVLAAGDPIEHLVVVARGRLNFLYTTSSGREQVVRALGPGEFLGEMALFTPVRCEGDLVAAEDTDVCLVPRQAVQSILRRHSDVAVRLVEVLAQRLAAAEQTIADLGLRDVGQRLAAELLRMAAGGTRVPDGIRLRVPVPWAEIAVRLGTTPESLSRRLKALAERGLIRQADARTVVVLDPEGLRRAAGG
ncbi:Crp/Fnr family transcriptional regulator [Caldinitratiruptor microaerophilus]|uniref:Crp/Fnr family transcriptional regulator n=1 Tax=Caldinitratiruptor microaerophilus TaxID=671077 RepID=A0AA35G726_9FIRM|nr:Crp/Fnr family transcriptional regulator [Caldinitratiruptor microaerophilus]BDG62191.1 Crp/Fnr family transcriptional regulator [Caldinitratiruptor microaerophilus]